MVIAFAAILSIESSSLEATARAKKMTTVAMLAKNLMLDAENEFQERTFTELDKERNGQFEAPYEAFSWEREVIEVEFPNLLSGMGGEDGTPREVELVSRLITKYLKESLREVIVRVKWKKGDGEKTFSLSTYWVNLNQPFPTSE